eukprot:COSAG01_NODE_40314_length_465_cov_0.887978_2_plen_50_part_01
MLVPLRVWLLAGIPVSLGAAGSVDYGLKPANPKATVVSADGKCRISVLTD